MSGPIIRRYGFPNFDQIFGKKELQHGVEGAEAETPAETPKEATAAEKLAAEPAPKAEKTGS